MNDSFRSNVFVRFSPETIACACIYLAARKLQFPLPNEPAWYELFDAKEEDLKTISLEILRLYHRNKANAEKLESIVNDLKKQQLEARLKAKGITQSDTSRPNTPIKADHSPVTTARRLRNEDARSEASFGHHVPLRKRDHSPDSRASSSRSRSRSPRRRARSPLTKKRKERSRDRRKDKHDRNKSDKYRKDDYYDKDYYGTNDYYYERKKPLQYAGHDHSPEQQKSRKRYYKEKKRSRSRSRSPYEVKRKSKKHNGHRRSRSADRYRR